MLDAMIRLLREAVENGELDRRDQLNLMLAVRDDYRASLRTTPSDKDLGEQKP